MSQYCHADPFGMLEALIHQLLTEAKETTLVAPRFKFSRYTTEGKTVTFENKENKLFKPQ